LWQLSLLSQHESLPPLDGELLVAPDGVRSLVEALARSQLRSLLAEGSQASSALAEAVDGQDYSEEPHLADGDARP